jgi:hypothetical protein
MSPGTERSVAAVVVAALAAPPDAELDALLGAGLAGRLRAELAARARRWADAAAPGRAFEATSVAAAGAALHGHEGPALLAAPDVPGLDAALAAAALDDLARGVDVALGVAHDARPYLIAVPHVDQDLLEGVSGRFGGGPLAAFAERGLELGALRSERRLATEADARALALDPPAPPGFAALVPGGLRRRPSR